MTDLGDRPLRTARELVRRTGVDHHDVLVILGSGLAETAGLLGASGPSLPLATLPFFPRYTATGHHAEAWSLTIGDKVVLIFAGRCHLYEGIEVAEVVHPLRTGIAAGCSTVVLTAAVGGLDPALANGSVVAVCDQINLTGRSPLLGPQFIDMANAYDPELRELARATPGVAPVPEAVYAQVIGPQFETRAEVAMLRSMGADVVGMSMAIETIAARYAGAWVLGLGVVTNPSAGPSDDLVEVAANAAPTVASIVRHVVGSLP